MKDDYKPYFADPVTDWVDWFAWKPVWTANRGVVWFRFVKRRRVQLHDYLSVPVEQWWQYKSK